MSQVTANSIVDSQSRDILEINVSMLPQNCSVHTDVLLGLAELVPKWRFLARHLQLQQHEIQQISENFPNDIHEQSYQMLKWKQSHVHYDDVYYKLGEAVRKAFGDKFYFDYIKMVTETEGSHGQ